MPTEADVLRAREVVTRYYGTMIPTGHSRDGLVNDIADALAEVRSEEREACAKVAK